MVGGIRAAWVRVAGELDLLTSPELESTLLEGQSHARLVVLDARDVTFIDSSGVHAILNANEISERNGTRLMVVPSTAVERIFQVVGADRRVSTFDLAASEPAPALHLV
jgi:anti-anti-sigma factor